MALKDIVGNMVGKFVEQGAAIADEFTLSKEEREQFKQRDADRAQALVGQILEAVQARYKQVTDVIVAEMTQGDSYTKRARPTIVYVGLALHIAKVFGSGFGVEFSIDPNFTYVWGGVCGVWIVGRSVEKFGANGVLGKAAGVVTGSRDLPEL